MDSRPESFIFQGQERHGIEFEDADRRQDETIENLRDRLVLVQLLDLLEDGPQPIQMTLEVGLDLAHPIALAPNLFLENVGAQREKIAVPIAIDDPLHLEEQLARRKRLGEVIVRSRLQTLQAALRRRVSGNHDDREALVGRLAPERLANVVTGSSGKTHIEDEKIEPIRVNSLQRLLTVVGRQHAVPAPAERDLEQFENSAVVVDDEDGRRTSLPGKVGLRRLRRDALHADPPNDLRSGYPCG